MGPVDVVIYDLLVTPKPPADIVQVAWRVYWIFFTVSGGLVKRLDI